MYKIVINDIINIIKILYKLFLKEKFIKYNLVIKIKGNYKLIIQKSFPAERGAYFFIKFICFLISF